MPALRLEHDTAAMSEVGVGAEQAKEVGEVGRRDPQVGAGIVLAPDFREQQPLAATNLHGKEEFADLESSRMDQHVDGPG